MARRTVLYDPNRPVVIRTFENDYEADLARALLEAADIPSMLVRQLREGGGVGRADVAVRHQDVDAALEVLADPPGGNVDG